MSVEILRITLLSLEGIELSEESFLPNGNISDQTLFAAVGKRWRITAWAGFRSSFPSDCMTVSTSHYSTLFEKEGNLLAIESDQIELDSSIFSNGKSDRVGRVHWQDPNEMQSSDDSGDMEHSTRLPHHHLQVTLPSHPLSGSQPNSDDLVLPDIIEIHVCIVGIELRDTARKKSTKDASCSQQHFCQGIAHLKLPTHEQCADNFDLSGFGRPGGKVVYLPSRKVWENEHKFVTFVNNAMLSLRVEKLNVPIEQLSKRKEAQHEYIESDWNGEDCAPASVNSFESEGKGNHILRAGQIISDIRKTFSSQISNLRKSDEGELPSHDVDSQSEPSPKKSFSQLCKLTCGELGDVLQGDEMGLYDHANTVGSSIATADVIGD